MTPFALWGFNLSVLWTSYFSHGYLFAEVLGPNMAWLDDHRGLIAWEGYFKISMLRFISYGMDYYWMTSGRPPADPRSLKKVSALYCAGFLFLFLSFRSLRSHTSSHKSNIAPRHNMTGCTILHTYSTCPYILPVLSRRLTHGRLRYHACLHKARSHLNLGVHGSAIH